jgi:hypothetical protein
MLSERRRRPHPPSEASLTDDDIAAGAVGAGSTGSVTLGAGSVPNGRSKAYDVSIAGGSAGDVVVFSVRGPMQDGVSFYGTQVVDGDTLRAQLCNFSGTTQLAITNLPVRILTFR